MSNFKSFVLLAVTAVASMGTAGVACAADPQSVPEKVVVRFKPEELNSEDGIKKVYSRIRKAAENVCPVISNGTLLATAHSYNCRQAAIASAVEAVHNKRLAEVASASKFG